MGFDAWILSAMEDAGYMDTSESCINDVAHYLTKFPGDEIDAATFRRACYACNVDPDSFNQSDLDQLQKKLNSLT
ncbi:MAG: hypothetical protein E7224_00645 [Clostridiales bacterium]|nr:hypothetical protein [Clostridiales bacterium]